MHLILNNKVKNQITNKTESMKPNFKKKTTYQFGKNACDSPPRLKVAKVADSLIMLKKGYYSNDDFRFNHSNKQYHHAIK